MAASMFRCARPRAPTPRYSATRPRGTAGAWSRMAPWSPTPQSKAGIWNAQGGSGRVGIQIPEAGFPRLFSLCSSLLLGIAYRTLPQPPSPPPPPQRSHKFSLFLCGASLMLFEIFICLGLLKFLICISAYLEISTDKKIFGWGRFFPLPASWFSLFFLL